MVGRGWEGRGLALMVSPSLSSRLTGFSLRSAVPTLQQHTPVSLVTDVLKVCCLSGTAQMHVTAPASCPCHLLKLPVVLSIAALHQACLAAACGFMIGLLASFFHAGERTKLAAEGPWESSLLAGCTRKAGLAAPGLQVSTALLRVGLAAGQERYLIHSVP